MKNFVFVLLVMVAFVGCATTGNIGGGSSSGESGSKLTDADLQKIDVSILEKLKEKYYANLSQELITFFKKRSS